MINYLHISHYPIINTGYFLLTLPAPALFPPADACAAFLAAFSCSAFASLQDQSILKLEKKLKA